MVSAIVFSILVLATQGSSLCPHEDVARNLKPWSQPSSWPGNQVPQKNDNVTITDNILLDTTPPELFGLVIQSGGNLVWSPDGDYSLRLRYIHVLGKLDIGSEDCKFNANAKITLIGRRGQYKVGGTEKVILVGPGGTLELHGKEKLSWTKLNGNVNKLLLDDGIYYDHLQSNKSRVDRWIKGLAIYVFDKVTGIPESFNVFYLKGSSTYHLEKSKTALLEFFNNVAPGKLVTGAVQHDIGPQDLSPIADAFEKFAFGDVTNSSIFRTIQDKDAYTFLIVAGDAASTKEDIKKITEGQTFAKASLVYTDFGAKMKMSVTSTIFKEKYWMNYWNFRSSNTDRSYPIIDVEDDVGTWKEGDKVILTSTDFDWNQAEIGTVIDCLHCTRKQVRLDLEVQYQHFGEVVNNVDMRGEMAMLSRNILIQGEVEDTCPAENGNCGSDIKYDTFGGHVKILNGFADAHIEGVELFQMGQQTDAGSYPLHFHMCEDVDNKTNPPYIRKSSIHNSFARCITIHGTHGLKIEDNTCSDFLGHGYFLEDGGEKRTVIDGNIGITTRRGTLLPSDKQPATFWITNPQVYVRNNVASGGQGVGYWFLFPDEPIMTSKGKGFMQKEEARHTAVYQFDNNVAHSNDVTGLQFDQKLGEDGSASGGSNYSPKVNPLDRTSDDKMVNITRFTAFKNRFRNTWIRGGLIKVTQSSFADSQRGVTFAKSDKQVQFITDSVIIGESKNVGNLPARAYDRENKAWIEVPRSLPFPWNHKTPVQGFIYFQGPVYVEDVWFDGFITNDNYTAGALGFLRGSRYPSSPVSHAKGVQFGFDDGPLTGNRVYDGNSTVPGFKDLDGDKSATFRDVDGSVASGVSQIVKPGPFYVTSACVYRRNWNVAHCPHKYGKVFHSGNPRSTKPIMARDDIPSQPEYLDNDHSTQFMTILGGTHSYTLHWNGTVPETIYIFGLGFEKDYWLRLGVCIPRDAKFDLYSRSPRYAPVLRSWVQKFSVADLDNDDCGSAYFWDSETGLLFFKLLNENVRSETTTEDCEGDCPMVRIRILNGTMSDGNCLSRAYPKYERSPLMQAATPSNEPVNLPATSAQPPSSFGAGRSRPFQNRPPVDGNWGAWQEWEACSLTCGGGIQYRRRVCGEPIPANGGKDCDGDHKENRPCNLNPCPIDGGWSGWSLWSGCKDASKCNGYQTRQRNCDHPQPDHGGFYCQNGPVSESRQCVMCS